MTVDDRRHAATPRGWRVLAGGLVAALAFGYASLGVTAQDATPGASPTSGDCVAPELPPGSPTPMDELASPEADEASPVAEASPVGDVEAPVGTPAEGDDADSAVAAADNFLNCVNGGDYEGAVALLTADFLLDEFGVTNPYDAVGFLAGVPFADPTVDNPQTYEDGSVSVDVQYESSEYQLTKERWTFVDEDGTSKLNSFELEIPDYDGDLAVIGLIVAEGEDGAPALTPNAPTTTEGGGLTLEGVNQGATAIEILALGLPEGADPAGLFDGSIDQEDTVIFGTLALEAGEQGGMLLVDLPVGIITLVALPVGPDGQPQTEEALFSEIEITAVE